jgi:hypothetical protein
MRKLAFLLLAAASALPTACATSVTQQLFDDTSDDGSTDSTTSTTTGSGGSGTTTASGGSGGAHAGGAGGGTTSDAGPPGSCQSAADCKLPADACHEAACQLGVCVLVPGNENAGCDDGDKCTTFDACHAGTCSGSPVSCPSSKECHIGTCDPSTGACKDVVGNDGGNCDDGDPCTVTSFCSAGACLAGQPMDCSFLDGPCSAGACDPQQGCVPTPLPDGTACDDGLFCTVNDACKKGTCTGAPNTCAAPGDVCMIGTCDEVQKSCVAVPGNDGKACDDQNLCTTGETCSGGKCVGGKPANDGKACDDGDGCTSGTTCAAGVCTNAKATIDQCIDNDQCCPAACKNGGGQDNDCQVCHPIGWDGCPSGAKQWCTPGPIDPTSAAQAKIACETCYGAPCYLEDGDCAGLGYGPKPKGQYVCGDGYFGYQTGCSGDEGRVWPICNSFSTYGYWGK